MPFKTWTPGTELLAADLNPYLQAQVVATFASAAARAAAWAAPPTGAVSALDANPGVLWVFNGTVWKMQTPQRGQVGYSVNNANSGTGTVTFPIPYAAPPVVLLTSQEANFYDMVMTILSLTATSFTWRGALKGAGNITGSASFFWLALEAAL